ncbi:MAG: two-component regulator propeller domain-containing protein, partial [Bacteroidota bacterium]
MRCLLICLASLWTITFAQAQTYQYRQYTTEDGLGHNQVFGIAEDSLGFMWFATDDGLYRFDGQDFYDMQRSDSRLRGSFTQLQKANDGGLWAGVYKKGVFKLSPGASNQYVERFFNIPISSDLIETESRLYTAIAKSIYRFEVDTTIIILFQHWFHDFFPGGGYRSSAYHRSLVR